MESLQNIYLTGVKSYVARIPEADRGRILRDIEALALGKLEDVNTKQLRGPIRELIRGNHRLTYFKLNNVLYFVRGFRKKTAKTPKQEIEYAEEILIKIKQLQNDL